MLDTTVLPVQNLINITMNKINTYNSLSTQTQYILTFKNTVMNKFVFCRPMIIYIPPWGLFRVIYQSKALNNDTSLQNNCMCFYNSNSKLNTILVGTFAPLFINATIFLIHYFIILRLSLRNLKRYRNKKRTDEDLSISPFVFSSLIY